MPAQEQAGQAGPKRRLTFSNIQSALDEINKGLEGKGARMAFERDGHGIMLVRYSGRVILSRGLTKPQAMKALEAIKGLADL